MCTNCRVDTCLPCSQESTEEYNSWGFWQFYFKSDKIPLLQPARLLSPWTSPGENTGVCCHFLLQGIFPNQGNLGLLHCRWLPYHRALSSGCFNQRPQIGGLTSHCSAGWEVPHQGGILIYTFSLCPQRWRESSCVSHLL